MPKIARSPSAYRTTHRGNDGLVTFFFNRKMLNSIQHLGFDHSFGIANPIKPTYAGGAAVINRLPMMILGIYMIIISITCFFLSLYFKDTLAFSGSQIGVLFSIQAVTGMLAAFPAGLGLDRISSRTFAVASLLIQAVCFAFMGKVGSFPIYALVFLIWSLSSWVFRMSIDVQVLKTVDQEQPAYPIGVFQAWRFAGLTVGMLMVGYALPFLDFSLSLILAGLACLILAVPAGFLAPTAVGRIRLAEYGKDFSNRTAQLFSLWMLLFATHWGAEQTCYGLFLKYDLKLSSIGMAWYIASEFAVIIITMLSVPKYMHQRSGVLKVALLGLLTSGIGHMGMVVPWVWLSVLFRMLHGVGDGCMLLIFYLGIAKLFPAAHMGGNAGIVNLATMIGYVAGSMLYGPFGEAFGYGRPLWISGLTTLLLIPPLWVLQARQKG